MSQGRRAVRNRRRPVRVAGYYMRQKWMNPRLCLAAMSAIFIRRLRGLVQGGLVSRSSSVRSSPSRALSAATPGHSSQEKRSPAKIAIFASSGLIGAAIVTQYYNFFESERDSSAHHQALNAAQLLEAERLQKEQLENLTRLENDLKTAEQKALDFAAGTKKLEEELGTKNVHIGELKVQAEALVSRLEEETKNAAEIKMQSEALASKLKDEFKKREELESERTRLLEEITELKCQIESSDLDRSGLLQKLTLLTGIFSFENTMMDGGPVGKEAAFLQGIDPLIDAALSSLPEEAMKSGSLTPLDLLLKLAEWKPAIQQKMLVPATGDDKVVEDDRSSVEDVFKQVAEHLKQRKLLEAADVLEKSVQGTGAEALAMEWVKQARLRAAIEQVYHLLRAHAATISMSLA